MHLPTLSAQRLRWLLAAAVAAFLGLAWGLPPLAQAPHYHAFADQRAWAGLPCALDVLSNAAFVLVALWGAWALHGPQARRLPATPRALTALCFAGLALTGGLSALYHWAPHDATLWWDRFGMLWAFAGLLGLAVHTRVDVRAAWVVAAAVLLAGVAALQVWTATGNLLPWAVLQGGGVLVLLGLACVAPLPGALPVRWGAVVVVYAVAKALEAGDAAVFAATQMWVSGHSLKHVVAAAAALPLMMALRPRRVGREGTIASLPLRAAKAFNIQRGSAR